MASFQSLLDLANLSKVHRLRGGDEALCLETLSKSLTERSSSIEFGLDLLALKDLTILLDIVGNQLDLFPTSLLKVLISHLNDFISNLLVSTSLVPELLYRFLDQILDVDS